MSGTKSSKGSKKDELYDNLFHSLDQYFGLDEEDVSLYHWLKEHVMGGKDFSFRGINLKEHLVEHTIKVLRKIDGLSRNKPPSELADEEEEDQV